MRKAIPLLPICLKPLKPSGHCVPDSGHYMYRTVVTVYRTVVTICTASLTFNNPTFCPHSVFMCFFVDLRTNSDYLPVQH